MANTNTLMKIAQLAEKISNDNFTNNGVDLYTIAKRENITHSHNDYGEYFLGALSHDEGEFHIYINANILPDKDSPRARFTFAHELGHYFIKHHREKLMEGESLTYTNDYTHKLNGPIEREANHFASRLLLPQSKMELVARNIDPGFPSIFEMKSNFGASIECTALRYVEANLAPCLLVRWRKDFTLQYCPYSKLFSARTGVTDKPKMRIDRELLHEKTRHIELPEGIVESAVRLSSWISSIVPNSIRDITCLEQTIKLGEYGGMTMLLL